MEIDVFIAEALNQGRAYTDQGEWKLNPRQRPPALARARAAYAWLLNEALPTATLDLKIGTDRSLGPESQQVIITDGQAYASYLLLPLLNLFLGGRVLIVGAPGRGKTTIATLMAMLLGTELDQARRLTQRGHPQMTLADLVGSPLPSELVNATSAEDIHVRWRHWLKFPIKIIDEYNRIPTKTQSGLLSLMAEGAIEQYEQLLRIPPSSWYLTANDDLGGGTFQVIEALQDRIDLVVRAPPLPVEALVKIDARLSAHQHVEELIPDDIRFEEHELESIKREITSVSVDDGVLRLLWALLAQLDFCQRASQHLSQMNKDTLRLSGRRLAQVCNEDCSLDKAEHVCGHVDRGISARAVHSTLLFARALAWFLGDPAVQTSHIRALLPWTLHDRVSPNAQNPFFLREENRILLHDRMRFVFHLIDGTAKQLRPAKALPVIDTSHPKKSGAQLERAMRQLLEREELNAMVHADLVALQNLWTELRRVSPGVSP